MTIFLYGPDAYRLKQGIGQVVAGYNKKYPNGLNLFSFDLSDKEQRIRFEDSLKTASLFEEAKLVVVNNFFASLPEYDIDKSKDINVMIVEPVSQKDLEKKNKKLFQKLISTSATVRNFEYLDGLKLANWVRSEFALRNCHVDTATARILIGLTGSESWKLANEIEKLANFKQKGRITPGDMRDLISTQIELNIFDLVGAVVSKNRPRAYELLFREIKNGRDPHYLLAMMAYGFRSRANKLSLEELRSALGKLLEMDTLSKNGSLDLTDSLFTFVLN